MGAVRIIKYIGENYSPSIQDWKQIKDLPEELCQQLLELEDQWEAQLLLPLPKNIDRFIYVDL